jgi:hypothetical protein
MKIDRIDRVDLPLIKHGLQTSCSRTNTQRNACYRKRERDSSADAHRPCAVLRTSMCETSIALDRQTIQALLPCMVSPPSTDDTLTYHRKAAWPRFDMAHDNTHAGLAFTFHHSRRCPGHCELQAQSKHEQRRSKEDGINDITNIVKIPCEKMSMFFVKIKIKMS